MDSIIGSGAFAIAIAAGFALFLSGVAAVGQEAPRPDDPSAAGLHTPFPGTPPGEALQKAMEGARGGDPQKKIFLDGTLLATTRLSLAVSWEPVNQVWVEGFLRYSSVEDRSRGATASATEGNIHLRMEF